jgi:hypothetical protein
MRALPALLLLSYLSGCAQHPEADTKVLPASFRLTMPLHITPRGIIVTTYWGKSGLHRELLWDNDSPTWINDIALLDAGSVTKSSPAFYSTTTADGTRIKGEVYTCDTVGLGRVLFAHVPFYKITGPTQGAFGEDLISKGVWEINFNNNTLTFASSIDSVGDLEGASLLPANFSNNTIWINVGFKDGRIRRLQLDLGFNGGMLLPSKDFKQLTRAQKHIDKQMQDFSTPGSASEVETSSLLDTVFIPKNPYTAVISTNKLAVERLIGLGFFQQFAYVILDYRSQRVYLSKARQ